MRLFVPVLAVAVVSGCNKSEFRVEHPFAPDTQAEIFLGANRHTIVSGAKEWTFKAPDVAHDKEGRRSWFLPLRGSSEGGSESLAVRIDAGCGPVDWCIGSPGVRGSDGPVRGVIAGRKLPQRDLCSPMGFDLHYDNRDGAATTLTVGPSIRVTLPANATGVVRVPPPSCEAATQVALDGKPIGSLPVVPLDVDWEERGRGLRDFLVDPGARRCYESTRYSYTVSSSMPSSDPSSARFERKELHALSEDIDHFFEKAPQSIEIYGGANSRTQLLPADCPPDPVP